jgi:hypothetical protein
MGECREANPDRLAPASQACSATGMGLPIGEHPSNFGKVLFLPLPEVEAASMSHDLYNLYQRLL